MTSKPRTKIPTTWRVPDGFVLTWYPPFALRGADPNQPINVYDDREPFVRVELPDGTVGYNPNVHEARLSQFGGVHPGVYALNKFGEHKTDDLHPDALQTYGKAT